MIDMASAGLHGTGSLRGSPVAADESRLAFVVSYLSGGTGDHLLSWLPYLGASGVESRIVTEFRPTTRREPSVPVHVLRQPRLLRRYPFVQAARLLETRGVLAEYQPVLVHAYFFWSIVTSRVLKMTGAIPRLVENREDLGFNWGAHEYFLLRQTRHVPDRVVCVCDAVRRVVSEREGLSEDQLVVIPNGVALPEERATDDGSARLRKELGLAPEAEVVGLVANYDRAVKAVHLLVEAAPDVLRERPGAKFVFVGRGDDGPLRSLAEKLGVAEAVRFVGFRSDVEDFYDLMDVSVITSDSEGLSISILESMRHGIPVVATDVGGNPELVRDGESGFLIPRRDAAALADRIVRCLSSADLSSRLGLAARARVRDEFNLARTAAAYQRLYDAVTG